MGSGKWVCHHTRADELQVEIIPVSRYYNYIYTKGEPLREP